MSGVWLPYTTHHRMPILEHGRRPETRGVVVHVNDGTFDGTISWFSGGSEGVGAHIEVGEGRVWQLADLNAKCWHAVDANEFAIGIEHAGFGRSRDEWLDSLQELLYSANRTAWILHQYNLGKPHYGHNIWPHSWGGVNWGNHDCPGPNFPWDTWMEAVNDAYYGHWGRGHLR
jgi:N-acetyl-anhydromuramyl-L-alanine amidase AmpD